VSPRGAETVHSFTCFGGVSCIRVGGDSASGRTAALAALLAQARLLDVHRRLSRFAPDSDLARLNADPHAVVAAGRLLRLLADAVVDAGERSGGLVDATRLNELERAGYRASRAEAAGLALDEIIASAPAPRPAAAHPAAAWRTIAVDHGARTITRPAGLRIDSGGLGKGLAADLVADALRDHPLVAIDCSGDVRIGGTAGVARPVLVEDPFGGEPLHEFTIADGAVATSGIGRRSWRGAGGAVAHHLLDPATGLPAWTGVVQATALAPTALEAEVLAKTALLAGPRRGRDALVHGGVLVLADRSVDVVAARPDRIAA
jgi:thiamine biosynthesis lipoprotein